MKFERVFTIEDKDPFDCIEWKHFDCVIKDSKGNIVFEQLGVEAPASWSQQAVNIVASKYFRRTLDATTRKYIGEYSVKQLIERVVDTICEWALDDEYFDSESLHMREVFRDELKFLLVNQYASFNSPVWFNVGVEKNPQCSACFINSVDDNLGSILDLAKTEGMLFKYGSGSGVNLSNIRGSKEGLNGGGIASGPVSFMKGLDAFAGVIKSGGKTRRAAKMVILDVDHPDIMEFIQCKSKEEKKAHALIDSGYDGSIDGDAYGSVFFQNSNNSVRVSDDFMKAVLNRWSWQTVNRTTQEVAQEFQAIDVWRAMAKAAWECGDPGIQFHDTINKWHTCPKTGQIEASNPCSEYMFLNDTACNLASLNLMKFRRGDGTFDVEKFKHAVDIFITAMDIIVSNASYPTAKITENSHWFRPLGLGYCNLGALLMANGLAYDSEEGRAYAAAITALMTGAAYLQSAKIANKLSPFYGFDKNNESMLDVIDLHFQEVGRLTQACDPDEELPEVLDAAYTTWVNAMDFSSMYGLRNSQVTVLAPTGTIGFMMDCDTTGIEPAIALVAHKKLVGGGMLQIVNQTVSAGLETLGYNAVRRDEIVKHLQNGGSVWTAGIELQHLSVFDCALGSRTIAPMGHVKMMAAVQPFLSGAISKTVNMPSEATVDDIADIYMRAWELGLKSLAVYRDGCKRSQPLNVDKMNEVVIKNTTKILQATRKKLADERQAITHKFSIAGHEGYITVGLYEDGSPGEVFITMSKEGSTISGLMDSLATSISLALQYGVPLQVLVDKFSHTRYEPSGFTGNRDIPLAKSITDYLFRWLDLKFGSQNNGAGNPVDAQVGKTPTVQQTDTPICHVCGSITVRSGTCHKCANCGSTSGCS